MAFCYKDIIFTLKYKSSECHFQHYSQHIKSDMLSSVEEILTS